MQRLRTLLPDTRPFCRLASAVTETRFGPLAAVASHREHPIPRPMRHCVSVLVKDLAEAGRNWDLPLTMRLGPPVELRPYFNGARINVDVLPPEPSALDAGLRRGDSDFLGVSGGWAEPTIRVAGQRSWPSASRALLDREPLTCRGLRPLPRSFWQEPFAPLTARSSERSRRADSNR